MAAIDVPVQARATPASAPPEEPPRLADGTKLLGLFRGSGLKNPPFLVQRGDGQVVQLPLLLYAVAERLDGKRAFDEIATDVGREIRRRVKPDDVRFLVEQKLRPLGVIAAPDRAGPALQKVDPLLALKMRVGVVPRSVTRALTTVFYPLFFPVVVATVVAGVVAVDVWLFAMHGVAQSTRAVLLDPALLLLVVAGVVVATAFHEIGHATATRYGGADPGPIGVGLYVVWPAFYTDVTDSYRLGRGGRLRTDLGGIYFNLVFVLVVAGAYFATGYEPLLLLIVIQHVQVMQQFLPFLRLDGYYVLADLTGVPDMFARIRPTLASVIPWRETHPAVRELKPWVRVVTTAWVLALVPILLVIFGAMLVSAPRVLATSWESLLVQRHGIRTAVAQGDVAMAGVGSLKAVFLVLPVAGMSITTARLSKRIGEGAWNWSGATPGRRRAVAGGLAAVLGFTGFVFAPDGQYRAIQPGERGRVQDGAHGVRGVVHVRRARPPVPTRHSPSTSRRATTHGATHGQSSGAGRSNRADEQQRRNRSPSSAPGVTETRTVTTATSSSDQPTTETTSTTPTSTTPTSTGTTTTRSAPTSTAQTTTTRSEPTSTAPTTTGDKTTTRSATTTQPTGTTGATGTTTTTTQQTGP
jgi:putative peptide zinc metalloprotease protein